MFQLNKKNIVIAGVVGAVVLGGVLFYFSGALQTGGKKTAEENPQERQEILSIAGAVKSVDINANSFVMVQTRENVSFAVILGENTDFVRVVFPFDIANPPAESVSFTPKREQVGLQDLKVNEQVFVRSASPIEPGQKDIVNPLEVQILP